MSEATGPANVVSTVEDSQEVSKRGVSLERGARNDPRNRSQPHAR